jgi:intracellular sulfur oxidation DsrE/DsrF family protein
MLSAPANRRSFVTRMAALVGAAALVPASAAHALGGAASPAATPGDEVEPWLAALNGKHRQLFHSHDKWRNGMDYARRWVELYGKEYGVPVRDLNAVLAMHGKTGTVTYGDAAWDKYEIGKRFNVTDPTTKAPARRNIFLADDPTEEDAGLRSTMAAGVTVLSCRTALRGFAKSMAATKQYGNAEEIERDLTASLVPGVILVPTMIVAIGRAQEHGCAYVYTG